MQFRGNLGGDPVAAQTKNGKPYYKFNVAEKTGKGQYEQVTWRRVSAFIPENVAAGLSRGSYVEVVGTETPRIFTRDDGTQEVSLDVMSGFVRLIENDEKPASKSAKAAESPRARAASAIVDAEDYDIPF